MTPLESSLPPRNNKEGGLTLIEVVIYTAIVVSFFGFSLLSLYGIIDSGRQGAAQREVLANAEFLLKKVEWLAKDASAINSPAAGAASTSLSLNKNSSASNPFIFDVSSGVARLKAGSGEAVALTGSRVTVESLVFENLNYQNAPPAVKTSVRIKSVEPGSGYGVTLESVVFLR